MGGKNSHDYISIFLNTHGSKKPLHLLRMSKDRTARQSVDAFVDCLDLFSGVRRHFIKLCSW